MSEFTTTPNLGLYKPNFNGDDGLWATHLNSNADKLDQVIGPNSGPWLPIAGGTLTGNLTVARFIIITGGTTGSGPAQLFLDVPTNGQRLIAGRTSAGATRWTIMPGDMTAESGANAGANFTIARYSDAGGFIDNPFSINRATGAVSIAGRFNAAGLPQAQSDGSPPAGSRTGDIYINGGVLCVAP